MNKSTGKESAHLVKDLLMKLLDEGFKGTFADIRKTVTEKLGHPIHSTFVHRPLMELQREGVANHDADIIWQKVKEG